MLHISHAVRLTFKSLLPLLFLSACSSTAPTSAPYTPISKVYYETYDKVWRATQIALQKYPIRVNNIDKGLLKTDYVKGFDVYQPPYRPAYSPAGLRYQLTVRTIKGRVDGNEVIKVVVSKAVEKKRDFFADSESLRSDGVEEKLIHYRIRRELQIDRALEKAQDL